MFTQATQLVKSYVAATIGAAAEVPRLDRDLRRSGGVVLDGEGQAGRCRSALIGEHHTGRAGVGQIEPTENTALKNAVGSPTSPDAVASVSVVSLTDCA